MTFDPFKEKPGKLEAFESRDRVYPRAYDKNATDPYTKVRIILMNGTEFESQWFLHNMARHVTNEDLRREIAVTRRIEQQQQKTISYLKPKDESILEHTIGYEQLAVDLTAIMARCEPDKYVRGALDFALLEDFDHLYRYADLLESDMGVRAERLVGKYTEIMPGRPTISEHRYPKDDVRRHMDARTASLRTKLHAMIITAGSCLVWFLVVPLVGSLADTIDPAALASLLGVTRADILADPGSIFTAENLFAFIGKPLGIGGIAMAGIIGIVKQSKIIRQAVGLAVSELGGGNKTAPAAVERTQRDLTMKRILTILIATLISVFVFFHFGLLDGWVQSVTAILIVFVIAFLFTTVAANAIAIVGTNPVSGMTLMTLILSSLVLVSVGLSGTTGMTAALIIGGVVCTALSMAGGFITDLKIGYWLGTTPRKQEAWKFLGTFVAAATVAGVMIILNKSYGFVGEGALVAPQANAMAAVIQPLMTGGQTPWMLYFCGAALALVLTSIGVPALAFALGMFIPMELNAPLVVGGLVAWFVSNRSKDEGLNKARFDRGTLIASGFIAGGALMGVVSALLKFAEVDWFLSGWAASNAAEWTGLAMYLVLIGYFAWHTLRARKEE